MFYNLHDLFRLHMPVNSFISYLRDELNRSPLTVEAYSRDLRQFIDWITNSNADGFKPSDITPNDIRAWLACLARASDTPRTIRRKAQSLRAFFRHMLRLGTITQNPASRITLPKLAKELPDVIRAGQMEGLLRLERQAVDIRPDDADTVRNALIIEVLYALGIRRAELVAISDPDISISAAEIKITGKRSKQRVVPLPPQLLERIEEWRRLRDSLWPDLPSPAPLFVANGKRISARQVYTIVNKELEGTDARRKSPHALRHTFATTMLNEGADINTVKEFLGHASLSTTQIYTHISFAEMKKAYEAAHPRAARQPDSDKKEHF